MTSATKRTACPPEIAEIIAKILSDSLLQIRGAGWSENPERCAILADHTHNLPHLLVNYSPELLRFYWNVERVAFIADMKGEDLGTFEPLWERLESHVRDASNEMLRGNKPLEIPQSENVSRGEAVSANSVVNGQTLFHARPDKRYFLALIGLGALLTFVMPGSSFGMKLLLGCWMPAILLVMLALMSIRLTPTALICWSAAKRTEVSYDDIKKLSVIKTYERGILKTDLWIYLQSKNTPLGVMFTVLSVENQEKILTLLRQQAPHATFEEILGFPAKAESTDGE